MRLIVFVDKDGCARSIRGNCIQPTMGWGSAMPIDSTGCNAVYTAVMEVWYV